MTNHTNYADQYDIEAGDNLNVTIELLSNGDVQEGTFKAVTDQAKTTPAGASGRFGIEDKHGRGMQVKLCYMDHETVSDDAVATLWMQGEKVAEVTTLEVEN